MSAGCNIYKISSHCEVVNILTVYARHYLCNIIRYKNGAIMTMVHNVRYTKYYCEVASYSSNYSSIYLAVYIISYFAIRHT